MAEVKGIKIGAETRNFMDETARTNATQAGQTATEANATASAALQQITELKASLDATIKAAIAAALPQEIVLWQNPDKTQPMERQTISVGDLSEYQKIRLVVKNTAEEGTNGAIFDVDISGDGDAFACYTRLPTGTSETSIKQNMRLFGVGKKSGNVVVYDNFRITSTGTSIPTTEIANNDCILSKIIGIKNPQ